MAGRTDGRSRRHRHVPTRTAAVDVCLGCRRRRNHGNTAGDELIAAGTARTTRALTIDARVVSYGHGLCRLARTAAALQLLAVRTDGWRTDSQREYRPPRVAGPACRRHRLARPSIRRTRPPSRGRGRVGVTPGTGVTDRLRARAVRRKSLWRVGVLPSATKCMDPSAGSGHWGAIGNPAFDVVHFVMEQKMMRGLRDRAERQRRDDVVDYLTQHRCDRGGIAAGS